MRLRSFRIVNFKSFADTGRCELGPINVFVGRNNAGKSAIIRAMSLLQAGNPVQGGDVRIGAPNAEVQLELVGPAQKYWGIPSAHSVVNVAIQYTRNGATTLSLTAPGYQSGVGQISNQEPQNYIYPYLSKRKVVQFDQVVDRHRTVMVPNDLQFLVSKVQRLANPDHEGSEEYERLCKDVLGFRVSTIASVGGQQAGIPVGRTDYIPIESMGEGVSSLLGLITELCMADHNLFLLEEPENDVHPEGLKAILRAINAKARSNQFVVSTHSNLVAKYLGAAEDSRLFSVEMQQVRGQTPTSSVRAVATTPEARIAVLQQLGYELYDFDLWEGWLILEESSAERIIRDYLIPWFAPRLTRIRTLGANGVEKAQAAMEDFHRLFCYAHLERLYKNRAWVVVDGGPSGVSVVDALRQRFSGWPANHFRVWSKADFEEYYPQRFSAEVRAALALTGQAKRRAKSSLLIALLRWCDDEPAAAKQEFEICAAEVIGVLRAIEIELVRLSHGRQDAEAEGPATT